MAQCKLVAGDRLDDLRGLVFAGACAASAARSDAGSARLRRSLAAAGIAAFLVRAGVAVSVAFAGSVGQESDGRAVLAGSR